MVLASSHREKQIQHSKSASRQFKSQSQRNILMLLTSGLDAGGVSEAHRAGEPGDSSGPRASSSPGSGALACGTPLRRGLGFPPRKSAGTRPSSPARHVSTGGAEQNRAGGTTKLTADRLSVGFWLIWAKFRLYILAYMGFWLKCQYQVLFICENFLDFAIVAFLFYLTNIV